MISPAFPKIKQKCLFQAFSVKYLNAWTYKLSLDLSFKFRTSQKVIQMSFESGPIQFVDVFEPIEYQTSPLFISALY